MSGVWAKSERNVDLASWPTPITLFADVLKIMCHYVAVEMAQQTNVDALTDADKKKKKRLSRRLRYGSEQIRGRI